jgi:hypothetical protein
MFMMPKLSLFLKENGRGVLSSPSAQLQQVDAPFFFATAFSATLIV